MKLSINLLDYLIELARLRSKIIRKVDDYQSVLWLHEIPREKKYCFTQAWGIVEESDQYKEIWVEITKYSEPTLDGVPQICEDWIDKSALWNTKEIPSLRSSINIQIEVPNPDANQDATGKNEAVIIAKVLSLAEYPEVSDAWEKFVDSKWKPYAELHRQWQSVQNVYSKLFKIYQEQLKFGEEYEFILGLGLLTWKTPSGHSVKRHLITAKAVLTFDAKQGKFTVIPSPDGAQLSVELDMLDIAEQPIGAKQTAIAGLCSADDNPWERSSINSVLNSLANLLADRGQGEFHAKIIEPSRVDNQTKPIVDLAPALILRKRSAQQVEEKLQRIREQIAQGGQIPPLFADICEENEENPNSVLSENKQPLPLTPGINQTIYFPNPANNEQLKIIEKLQLTDGVLVQGPPGTGKSHTIANLICHLLATGQRVLVTAKTPRALQVLHEKLPKTIQPLCISLLGSGIDERKSLESSVSGILSELDRWDKTVESSKARNLEESLHFLKTEEAKIKYQIQSIREADTHQQSIINGTYHGTAGKIALRLEKESVEFGWFQDNICYDQEAPFSVEELKLLHDELSCLTPKREAELQMEIPDPQSDLPSRETLGNLIRQYRDVKKSWDTSKSSLDSPQAIMLESTNLDNIRQIAESVSTLNKMIENVRNQPFSWVSEAINDILSGNGKRWEELRDILQKKLSGLKERAQISDSMTLTAPDNCDLKKLLQDAKSIKQHFDGGGGTKQFGIFYPKVIRERKYIIENVKMDGCLCDSPRTIEALIEYLSTHETIDYAWKLWEGKAVKKEKSVALQIAELKELQQTLNNTLDLCSPLNAAKKTLHPNIIEPAWHDPVSVNEFIGVCRAIICKSDFVKIADQLKQVIVKIESLANQPNSHPLVGEVLSAVKRGDVDTYSDLLKKLAELSSHLQRSKQTKVALRRLTESAPLLARQLLENPQHEEWKLRLAQFEMVWKWARANSWLRDFLNKENLPSLERRLRQIDDDKKKQLTELSAIRAWSFCFSRMTDGHRRHFVGWHDSMRKVGKGTGKHAPQYRQDAQRNLNKCRDAVPAWVMPLHRVYETIDPLPSMFDLVIVDEASQCGLESLPLMYIAKRLIVVGDDQQISPEAVGVDREEVFRLRDDFLKDFEHPDSFNIDSSLFDHAKRRFSNRIVLREHFRCVPEIIHFSNDLCYSSMPLIPLRQYPPKRLEPLKKIHIIDGYREGTGSKVINRREAEELVKTIAQCCNDKQYDGKTMGVISLQGDSQSAYIQSMLLEEIGAEEMDKRRLICGNPYSFQGDERHIIFLSMIAAPNERIGVFSKDEDKRRFNVAASRAQDQMWLFHSATLNDLSQSCLRKRLLDYFTNPVSQITKALGEEAEELQKYALTTNRQIEKPPPPYESWFELDVALQIASQGFRVVPQYPVVNNKRIDLVIEGNKSRLAVECDGDFWHGLDSYEKDMDRQRMLERCGWTFFRIRESFYYANRNEALQNLWEILKRHDIHPITN